MFELETTADLLLMSPQAATETPSADARIEVVLVRRSCRIATGLASMIICTHGSRNPAAVFREVKLTIWFRTSSCMPSKLHAS
jgi:hypothetical protein